MKRLLVCAAIGIPMAALIFAAYASGALPRPTPPPLDRHQQLSSPVLAPTPVLDPNTPSGLTVVVNRQRPLPLAYVPANLVTPRLSVRYPATSEQSHLRAEVAQALEDLFRDAAGAGYRLTLLSGYRSASTQAATYANVQRVAGQAAADRSVARPGYSEHQTGLAADVGRLDRYCELQRCFGDTPEGRWLVAKAARYGFIIRYPAGQEATTGYQYEPWHLRYVGTALAQLLADQNQLLDTIANSTW